MTSTPIPATEIPTSVPPTAVPTVVTVTPGSPATPSGPAPTRISFSAGATQAVVTSNLPADSTNRWVLTVEAGQLMDISLTPDQGLQLSIVGADGALVKPAAGSAFFRGTVPETQDYVVAVTAASQAVSYTMDVQVPQRITFAEGATSATVDGTVPANGLTSYVVNVQAGQLVDFSFSPEPNLSTSFYGVDGDVLKSGMGEGSAFRGTVPTTQDYIIDVKGGAQDVSYTLNLTIPQRITFAQGATTASFEGQLDAHGTHTFVVNVQAGQLMDISAFPSESLITVVYGVDGTVLQSPMGGFSHFRGTVPTTQDYIIDVTAGDTAEAYTFDIAIPARITYAPNTTSATVQGQLAAQTSDYYILSAQAGQSLTLTLTPKDSLQVVIFGVDGTVLKSGMGNGSDFTGTIPTTQDYLIVLTTADTAVSYTLAVSVK